MTNFNFRVITPVCPKCGAEEVHPTEEGKVLIRGAKVYDQGVWWSQCLVCAGAYDADLFYNGDNYNENKGWFHE